MEVSIYGHTFEVGPEPADFWGWVKEGRYDKEWKLISAYLTPEHTFLDLGAWVGSHSLLASTVAKRVVAVEPDPVAFAILQENVSGKAETAKWAVGNHNGTITLGSGLLGASTTRANSEAGGGIGKWEEGQTFEAVCTRLRDIVSMLHLEDPLFIKMDIEGSEEDVLADLDFFSEHKPILYLEKHPFWWKDKEKTLDLIRQVSQRCTVIS